MQPRRTFLRALAAGLGGASVFAAETPAAGPAKTSPPELGALVARNFTGRS